MSLRREFVLLARQPGANISALCRGFSISRKTGYKWLERPDGEDRSRRPLQSPSRTVAAVEAQLLAARDRFPDWGARKLRRWLENSGARGLPAVSTITAILHRHARITPAASAAATPWQRFEHPAPNALWQMDFKGHVALQGGQRCHPLTVLDDHSRFNIVLRACRGEACGDVKPALQDSFRRYGLPDRISCDNGTPWGTMQREDGLTVLGAWLLRLGVCLSHARPGHPQTNGKDERFHRTLHAGLLRHRTLRDFDDAQRAFDGFRDLYNLERPHQAIGLEVPATRYRRSERAYPEVLPPIEYDPAYPVRRVDATGKISFRNRTHRIAKALVGEPVALVCDPDNDGCYTVIYCRQPVRIIDLRHDPVAD